MQQTETGDAALWVEFFKRPIEIKWKSEKEGRPIYEDRDWVRIVAPGDQTSKIERIARDDDKLRFSRIYERYKAGQEMAPEGTPLEAWPAMSPAHIEELKHLKLFTVEQLAAASDAQCQRLGAGMMALKLKAGAYLETARDTATAQKYAAENAQLRQEMEDLKAQFAQLSAERKGKREAA